MGSHQDATPASFTNISYRFIRLYCFIFTIYVNVFNNIFLVGCRYVIRRAILLLYLSFIYYDHKKHFSNIYGNGWLPLRNNFLTKHMRDYFPIELVKTAELKPNRNYILACFPHGVIGTGVTNNMGNNIGKWLQLFPGVRPKIATLDVHFYIPFLREILRFWGLISCSKESLIYYLTKSNDPEHSDNKDGFTSNAVALLVGGAQESLDSHPRHYVLTIKSRQGFVKVAIRTGSAIVPSFSFGEVDIYDQVNNSSDSRLRRFQLFVKELTGVSPLIVIGRGFFQYNFGFIPQRHQIVQVVGSPIEVKQTYDPDPQYVNEIHQKVIQALEEMFEKHKHKYIENANNVNLVIN
uniref:Acyltransferase n=1 Tax=Glossina morsitans morsitans TaxID=37546 RepID=R4IJZ8_GLOMM|nr:2-acylglycerol o-acyltransferase [Glossina morsitans morsitans]